MGGLIRRALLPLSATAVLGLSGCAQQGSEQRLDAERLRLWLQGQFSRGLAHPVRLGPFQGLSLQGLEFGPSRVLPTAADRSSMQLQRLTLRPDLFASLRQGRLVSSIGLGGMQLQLHRNAQGSLWIFPKGDPTQSPPRLRLKLRLLDPGRLQLDESRPWRFGHGRLDLNLAQHQLNFSGHVSPQDSSQRRARLSLRISNQWSARPRLSAQLQLRQLPARSLAEVFLPQQAAAIRSGLLSGNLRLQQRPGQVRCRGPLRLRQLALAASSQQELLRSPLMQLRCRGQRLTLAPLRWSWRERKGDLSAEVKWKGSPADSLELKRLLLSSADSQLQLAGSLSPQIRLRSQMLQLNPSLFGQDGDVFGGTLALDGQQWRLKLQQGSLSTAAGDLKLRGEAAGRWLAPLSLQQLQAQLELDPDEAEASGDLIPPPLQGSLRWAAEQQRLELKGSSSLAGEALQLEAFWRPKPDQPWQQGELAGEARLSELPLSAVDRRWRGSLSGALKLQGTPAEPKLAATFSLQQPGIGPLVLPERWQGSWQPGALELRSATTEITALLDGLRLQSLQGRKGEGRLSLQPQGDALRWQVTGWSLSPLRLGLRGNEPLPLTGVLQGSGRLALDPLALSGRAQLDDPTLAWIQGRKLKVQGQLGSPGFAIQAELTPPGPGSLQLNSRGAWNGPLVLEANARRLQAGGLLRLLRDLQRPAVAAPIGEARDLGTLAIDTLGQSLDFQIRALQKAQADLAAARPLQPNTGRLDPQDVQGFLDADLEVRGPKPAQLWIKLASKGHLWLRGENHDQALQLEPFVARLNGPLGQGGGQFSFAGLPLGFLALLTPVPATLRGALRGQGNWQLGGGSPMLSLDLGLTKASLQGQSLRLERGRIELEGQALELDLALRGGQASSNVELRGTLPLDADANDLELRIASRGDGLVFLTALSGGELEWRQGTIDLQLLVRGSRLEPIANGFLRIRDGSAVLAGQSVQDLQAAAFFDFQRLQIEQLQARIGDGSLSGSGSLALRRGISSPGVTISLSKLPIERPNLKLLADGSVKVGGSLLQPSLGGQLQLSQGLISVKPSLLASGSGTAVPLSVQMPETQWDFSKPVVLLGPSVESSTGAALRRSLTSIGSLRFQNLRLGFGPKLRISAPPLADFRIGGLLTLNGPAGPDVQLSGVVRLLKGRINVLTSTLKLDSSNANAAVFTPSLGLIPYLDVVLTTRVSDRVRASNNDGLISADELQGSFTSLDRLNLVKVIVTVRGPADRIVENVELRSVPPMPREKLVALLGGNSLAGLAVSNAGTALATVLGGTLLTPVLGGFSDLFGDRLTASIYPAYLDPYVEDRDRRRKSQRVPSQLVLGAEVGVDITERLNFSVLSAPNRSDIPPEAVLRYQATDTLGIQGALDQQGQWQGQLQLFFRF